MSHSARKESTPMPGPGPSGTIFLQIARDRWHAAMQTPTGRVSAIGDSKDDAQHQLDELLAMRRALEFTLEVNRRRQRRRAKPSPEQPT